MTPSGFDPFRVDLVGDTLSGGAAPGYSIDPLRGSRVDSAEDILGVQKAGKKASGPWVAQTSVCDICDMLMPLEAEVDSLHASSGAFLRPQPFSLYDHQHPAGSRPPPTLLLLSI